MGLDSPSGGHMSHGYYTPGGKKVSGVSIFFESFPYKVDPRIGYIDYDKLEEKALEYRPKILICGGSLPRFRHVADKCGHVLMFDMAQISGLLATKVIEKGKKKATKFRNIKLHRVSDNPLPTEKFTASNWPSIGGDTLKALAGKVSADYDFIETVEDDSLEKSSQDDTTVESDTSAFGIAFDPFGGSESGKEACHAIASLCQGSNVSGKDSRVHCSLNINTATVHLSARGPNLRVHGVNLT
ncbi:unnamed protein product [Arabis nemorensis]|uniref:Serine hydroxymethyltransferase-like domain-containing protein n=1 Tax=Arabis nemorensis TaxID=586526 RepID=A0A565BD66_9BRAS|nr:unnamed protein product [Arabis nemorensis]